MIEKAMQVLDLKKLAMTQLLTVNNALEARMKLTPQNANSQAKFNRNKAIEQMIRAEFNRWRRKLYFGLPLVLVFTLSVSAKARSHEQKRSEQAVRLENTNPRNGSSHPAPTLPAASGGNDDCPAKPIPAGTYTAAAPFTESGDTTGANDTVRGLIYDFWDFTNTKG